MMAIAFGGMILSEVPRFRVAGALESPGFRISDLGFRSPKQGLC